VKMRRWAGVLIIGLAPFTPATTGGAQSEPKQVLVLHSTRRDAQFSLIGENELPRILDAALARNLDYYSEFIDLARFPEAAYQDAFRDFLRTKYQGVRFDLVIAMHDAATDFVNTYGDTLFGDTPVVFLANNPATSRRPNSTGVIHKRDFAATIDLVRRLQPDVRQVFIVIGAARSDKAYEQVVRQQLQSLASGLTFTYLSGLPTQELEERLAELPQRSTVYYVIVTQDGAGHRLHPLNYLDRVTAAANAATYSWLDSAMGRGILGGSLYSQRAAIERVAQLALRVLRGEPADSIPIDVPNLNANQVDWRQLRRWRISEGRVPPGTLILFQDLTVWDRYKTYILAALALLVIQTALITGLLIQRKRRRRAEEELRASQGELRRSYERNRDLAARLLRAQETERSRIARELHDDICQRMLLLTIELESMDDADRHEENTGRALAVARDVAKSLHELSHQLHPTRLRVIGLVSALDRLCLELSRAGFAVTFTHASVPSTLSRELMLCLFRVVQESLQNAIKYSGAGEVSVTLTGGPSGLVLTIVDTGVGFDVGAAWGKGVGLVSMVERVEAIGGSLEISSEPGAGTRLTATIPPHVVQTIDEIFAPEQNLSPSVW
jgi:signal transduction histidine kinase